MKIELTFITACINLVALFVISIFFGTPVILIASDAGILVILAVRISLGEIPRRYERYFLGSIVAITACTLLMWIV
ncbi:MAG: hypothetical protein FJY07_00380 [Bacteroidetes bacterium]|nr:hypothetical protein [Bacteroidota bacterium]